MEPIKHTLTFERSTKRYHVYVDLSGVMVPPRWYVAQSDLGNSPVAPETITVTVTTDEANG